MLVVENSGPHLTKATNMIFVNVFICLREMSKCKPTILRSNNDISSMNSYFPIWLTRLTKTSAIFLVSGAICLWASLFGRSRKHSA